MMQNLNVARLHLDAAQAALDALAAELDEWDENRKAYEDVSVPDAIDAVCEATQGVEAATSALTDIEGFIEEAES